MRTSCCRFNCVCVCVSVYMQCEELAKEGASVGSSPADVVSKCPITIAMLADPAVALTVGFLLLPYYRMFQLITFLSTLFRFQCKWNNS